MNEGYDKEQIIASYSINVTENFMSMIPIAVISVILNLLYVKL